MAITTTVQEPFSLRGRMIPMDFSEYRASDRNAYRDMSRSRSRSISLTPLAKQSLRSYRMPFKGFTTDGNVISGLWSARSDAKGPCREMVNAAQQLLTAASPQEKQRFRHLITAREWRAWSNPEILVIDSGLRVVDMSESTANAVNVLLQSTLSHQGYEKIRAAMSKVSTRSSYDSSEEGDDNRFCLFGEPSTSSPWGFNLWGRNVSLNVFASSGELVVGPFTINEEPVVDEKMSTQCTEVLGKEATAGHALLDSLSEEQKEEAMLHIWEDEWDGSEVRSVGGAHHDNRTVPYQGICAKDMNNNQRQKILDIVRTFNELLPEASLRLMMERVEQHLDQTYFTWDGSLEDGSLLYYRIHSPMILNELDYREEQLHSDFMPKTYRVHAIQRLPNRGDYGAALLDEWVRQVHVKIKHQY